MIILNEAAGSYNIVLINADRNMDNFQIRAFKI